MESIPHYQGKEIRVTRSDLESATNAVMGRIQTSAMDTKSTLVNIVCQDVNIARADAILTSILQVYNETIVEDKNRIAVNTAKFIDERIAVIGKELGDVEEELTDFKQRNRIIGSEGNGSQFLAESSRMKTENLQMETELSIAQSIKSYLHLS